MAVHSKRGQHSFIFALSKYTITTVKNRKQMDQPRLRINHNYKNVTGNQSTDTLTAGQG